MNPTDSDVHERDSRNQGLQLPSLGQFQSVIFIERRFFEWYAFEVKQRFWPSTTRHIVGCSGQGRLAAVTEPIVHFEAPTRTVKTEGGHTFTLGHKCLLTDELLYAWQSFVDRKLATSVVDITQELRTAMKSVL